MPKTCPSCGKENTIQSKHCNECGAKFKGGAVPGPVTRPAKSAPSATKVCPKCKSEIPASATKCSECRSTQPASAKAIGWCAAIAVVLVIVGAIFGGHKSGSGSSVAEKSPLKAWYDMNGDAISSLGDAAAGIGTTAGTGDAYALRTSCRLLLGAVTAAKKTDPIPVRNIDAEWRAALRDFGAAASGCIGADFTDATVMKGVTDKMESATSHVKTVSALVKAGP